MRNRDNLSVAPKKFDRFGDSHYLRIDSGEALRQVLALPEARWFASNAPVEGFRAEPTFLKYLEDDGDGRLRPRQIKAAIRWLFTVLERFNDESVGSRSLNLSWIKKDSDQGRQVLAAAETVIRLAGKEGERTVSLNDVDQVRSQVIADGLNRAGYVGMSVQCGGACRQLIDDIVETTDGASDAISREQLEAFLDEIKQLGAWEMELDAHADEGWLPFGEETEVRYQIYREVYDRLEVFFALCQLSKVSPVAKTQIQGANCEGGQQALSSLDEVNALAASVPITAVNSDAVLKFNGVINPQDAAALRRFRDLVFRPLHGEEANSLKRDYWERIKERFATYEAWRKRIPSARVETVDRDRRRRYLKNAAAVTELKRLFEESEANAQHLENVQLLEKAILFQAHLLAFANNFVSCPDLFAPAGRALFEMGTLILDGREFSFCVRVPDRTRHVRRCQSEDLFIIYADISDFNGNHLYEIAAPVTSGFRGHIQEGQWGVFHDSEGEELNARVSMVLESPISLGEGLLAPLRRFVNAALIRLDAISLDAEKGLEDRMLQARERREEPRDPTEAIGRSRSFLTSGGLTIAALAVALAYVASTLARMDLSRLVWAVVGLVVVVVAPLLVATGLRLSRRDLRCLLEGAGWGINLRMRLTPTLARLFTRQRRL